MKTRIKEVAYKGKTTYYPQYFRMMFWVNFATSSSSAYGDPEDVVFDCLDAAKAYIDCALAIEGYR